MKYEKEKYGSPDPKEASLIPGISVHIITMVLTLHILHILLLL
jgi:hypothetical protein